MPWGGSGDGLAMKTILTVDDSAGVRRLLALTLSGRGDRVIEACDGRDALSKLVSEPVHLIITDLNMPEMSGVELVRRVRALPQYASVPILILTSDSQSRERAAGKAAGATGWITKPFTRAQMGLAVEKILGPGLPRRTGRRDPLQLFRVEAEELLARIDSIAGELKQRPADVAAIERMFRAFHTIKGTGAMFGFDRVAGHSHHFALVFREAVNGARAIDEPLLMLVHAARNQLRALLDDPVNASLDEECRRTIAALRELPVKRGSAQKTNPESYAHDPAR
jgi:two-component system chemotaxis response regulator CheY